MVSRDLARFQHMIDSIEACLSYVKGKTRADLNHDRLLISGIVRELEILGEAAGAITKETKERFPELPWKQSIGMRNRLIHAYFDVDNDVIWKTVQEALPPLLVQLQECIAILKNQS